MLILLIILLSLFSHRLLRAFSPAILEYPFCLTKFMIKFLAIVLLFATDKFVKFILIIVNFFKQFLNILCIFKGIIVDFLLKLDVAHILTFLGMLRAVSSAFSPFATFAVALELYFVFKAFEGSHVWFVTELRFVAAFIKILNLPHLILLIIILLLDLKHFQHFSFILIICIVSAVNGAKYFKTGGFGDSWQVLGPEAEKEVVARFGEWY